MKKFLLLTLVFSAGVGVTAVILLNPTQNAALDSLQHRLGIHSASTDDASQSGLWTCGMHPQVLEEAPGLCPICKMDLTPVEPAESPAPATAERVVKFWRAPMDPTYISDKPGKSPMGMDLVPVFEDEVDDMPGVVHLGPRFLQGMGVDTMPVERGPLQLDVRSVGTIRYNDDRTYQVTTKFGGWVEASTVNAVGTSVSKGQQLFELFSPELIAAQKEFLQAIDYSEKMARTGSEDLASRAASLVAAARQRLGLWDVTADDIARLETSRQPRRTISIYSPATGVVVATPGRGLPGRMVKTGESLLEVTDLSVLWVEADIFESQLEWVRIGQTALVEVPGLGKRTYSGKVRYILPELAKRTRTLRVSLEVENPNGELRPGMYSNVYFSSAAAGSVLRVQQDAVIRSGLKNLLIVDLGDGRFQVREVQTGRETPEYVEVLSGVREGEPIVVSSQFLIDSESNLQATIRQLRGGR